MAKYTSSKHGNPQLVDSVGYSYIRHKSNNSATKVYWRCQMRTKINCMARATTEGIFIVKYIGEHIHPPWFETEINPFISSVFDWSILICLQKWFNSSGAVKATLFFWIVQDIFIQKAPVIRIALTGLAFHHIFIIKIKKTWNVLQEL